MAKRNLKRLMFLSLLFLTGCSDISAIYNITLGNFYFSNNRLQEADYRYRQSLENEKYRDILLYNLGTVYFHLGEFRAAMDIWSHFTPGSRKNLDFRFFYNRALLKAETGDYRGAFADLKEALAIDSKNREAKRNLEVVLNRMLSESAENQAREAKPSAKKKEIGAASQRIFNYVKRSEVFEWERPESQDNSNLRDW